MAFSVVYHSTIIHSNLVMSYLDLDSAAPKMETVFGKRLHDRMCFWSNWQYLLNTIHSIRYIYTNTYICTYIIYIYIHLQNPKVPDVPLETQLCPTLKNLSYIFILFLRFGQCFVFPFADLYLLFIFGSNKPIYDIMFCFFLYQFKQCFCPILAFFRLGKNIKLLCYISWPGFYWENILFLARWSQVLSIFIIPLNYFCGDKTNRKQTEIILVFSYIFWPIDKRILIDFILFILLICIG